MSAAALFTTEATGRPFIPVIVNLADIPRAERNAALYVYNAVLDCLYKGKTETSEAVTDQFLKKNTWLRDFSLRFIQKGLLVLQKAGLIRRTHRYGTRRRIVVLGRLKGRPRTSAKAKDQAEAKPAKGGKAKRSQTPNTPPSEPPTPEQLAAAAKVAGRDARALAEHKAAAAQLTAQLADQAQVADQEPAVAPEPAFPPRLRLASAVDPDDLKRQLEEQQRRRLAKLAAIPPERRDKFQDQEYRLLAAQFGDPTNRSP
jgi:hypothetical protein